MDLTLFDHNNKKIPIYPVFNLLTGDYRYGCFGEIHGFFCVYSFGVGSGLRVSGFMIGSRLCRELLSPDHRCKLWK